MIIVKISGGIGNQMFQYAMIYALQKQYPETKILADVSCYKLYDVHYGLELNKIFHLDERALLQIANIYEQWVVRGEIPLFCGGKIGVLIEKPVAWINARTRKLFERFGKRNVIKEETYLNRFETYDEGLKSLLHVVKNLDLNKNWYVDGYWQNEIFFQNWFDDLRQIFIFPELVDSVNIKLAEAMQQANSVSVHIRRGDYVNSSFDILTDDYYRRAIEYIQKHVDNPIFYFFSEDRSYIQSHFNWLNSKIIVDNNIGEQSFRDMQLMSICKHNIVANSSFSAWAGFLNANKDKIVVYPSKYRKHGEKYEDNVKKLEDGWVMLDI